jgi:hypothetical protein
MLRRHDPTAVAAVPAASGAQAAVAGFDFTSLGSNGTALAQNVTVNTVRADAFKYLGASNVAGGTFSTQGTTLWLRNQTNDHCLGVCSEGSTTCKNGGGDVNELSSLNDLEVMRRTRPDNFSWTELWVSSLDGNGNGSPEDGLLYYSNAAAPDLASTPFVQFSFPAFTGNVVEGDLFTLAAFSAQALRSAKYLLFKPGASGVDNGNNDYLVWKGAIESVRPPDEVPEPSTYALLLAGLGMLGAMARRRARS